ncbi:MAG TPA: O-antigen ligase family protein [Candidatus Acidoferrales bacterium]|nr:O-antigen ligase family protein [Candidatus Acidoferrales bacterium]
MNQTGVGAFAAAAREQLAATRSGMILAATPPLPEGVALLWPVYLVLGCVAAVAAFLFAGIETVSLTIAALIALWAFIDPRTTLWLSTAFMIFLFVFFQTTAPLGEEVPEEFFYWGVGVALIAAGLAAATIFSSQAGSAVARQRLGAPASLAMFGMTLVICAASVYGLWAGNQFFAVARQLFGCLLLPVYFYLSILIFRAPSDVDHWLRRVSWVVALGSAWYVLRLSQMSLARGAYYREQSPLTAYAGAIAVIAWVHLFEFRRISQWFQALVQCVSCIVAALLMGSRTTLGSSLAAIAVLTIMMIWRRHVLSLTLAVIVLSIGMGIAPYVMTRLVESRGLVGDITDRFIFVLSEDHSYQGRLAQTEVVMNMVEKRPVLGAGMGSENVFILPGEQRRVKVASVDNGWGYLLLKMGYLGLAIFLTLVGLLLKRGFSGLTGVRNAPLRTSRLAVLGVFLYALISFLGGPIFFHFSVAPFFATAMGALVVLGEAREPAANAPATRRDASQEQKERAVPCSS